MSECTRSLEPLLEADLGVLAGEGDSELAKHIRGCGRCGGAAQAIREATGRLDEALSTAPAALDLDAVLRRVEVAAAGRPGPGVRGRFPAARWVALAAAATAALIIVGEREPASIRRPTTPPRPTFPLVEPAADRSVAVIPTGNPDITIVWFFPGD